MYLVPKKDYNVGVDRDEQNLRHHVSMTQLIGCGKKGMNKQELKEFVCNEIDNGSPNICLESFMQPRKNVEFPDLPPDKRKTSTKRKRSKKITNNRKNSNNRHKTTNVDPPLAAPSSSFHFPTSLQWKDALFLPKMTIGDNVYVCTGEKDGVQCGFALCSKCKERCSAGRSSRRSRGVAATASNSLTNEEKTLLTGCHCDHSRLQQRGHNYFGSGKDCPRLIRNTRVFNCAFCLKFHHVLKDNVMDVPELKERFGL